MLDEMSVIRRILNGERDAYRTLVERYQQPIYRFVFSLAHDRHWAEDLTQEIFLTAFEKLNRFDSTKGGFSTWLFTIAHHQTVNGLKRPRLRFEKQAIVDRCSQNGEPVNELLRHEWMTALDKALERLPLNQRIAFVLAEIEQLSHQQIADIGRTRIGTVKSRVSRAKAALRKTLDKWSGMQP